MRLLERSAEANRLPGKVLGRAPGIAAALQDPQVKVGRWLDLSQTLGAMLYLGEGDGGTPG